MSISGGSPRAVRHAKQTAALARTATCESGKAKHFTWPSMAIRWCKQVMDIDGHWTSRNEVVFCWGPSCHNKDEGNKAMRETCHDEVQQTIGEQFHNFNTVSTCFSSGVQRQVL
jgi:hypothetical protein